MTSTHPFQASEIETRVSPMLLRPLPDIAYTLLERYLGLLFHWNQKMNLTAVRDPGVLVALHLAECLRAAQRIPEEVRTVLDFGSGAGLPGIPIQIARPELHVTLAESQQKKTAFLREAARELGLSHTVVYSGRVEDLPAAQTFDLITLRAVDRMGQALRATERRIGALGFCMVLTSQMQATAVKDALSDLQWKTESMPGTKQRVLLFGSKNVDSKKVE
jgi:16S rRNA (guanine527-N7)-methyltransferase